MYFFKQEQWRADIAKGLINDTILFSFQCFPLLAHLSQAQKTSSSKGNLDFSECNNSRSSSLIYLFPLSLNPLNLDAMFCEEPYQTC